MPPPIESLLTRLEQLEESARAIVSLLITSAEPFETAWDTANRICDRYRLPQVAAEGQRGSAPHAAQKYVA
jgi:hypothetical protein